MANVRCFSDVVRTPNECGALSLAEVWRDEHTKQTENSTEHTSV
eukprot:COSAG06_NODE_71194_length_187_cov_16.204545_1_plen_43_part_10